MTHATNEYGTTNCPVEGVRAFVDDGDCSACGAVVAAQPSPIDHDPTAAAEMGAFVAEAFFTYEDMREQRDQARRVAAALEAEVAKVRELHKPLQYSAYNSAAHCAVCPGDWPCRTAAAVYLTDGA